jgi:hypothetical protein
MIATDIDLEWKECWSRPDPTCPVSCGVDSATDQDGRKLYRAYARCSVPEYDMQYSPVYQACDLADLQIPDTSRVLMTSDRDRIVGDAARVRALMGKDEKSPQDMADLAEKMCAKAIKNFRAWEDSEVTRRAKELDDAEALKMARYWLRGLELLQKTGTMDEKRALSKFMKA